jgi:hypothetical protein
MLPQFEIREKAAIPLGNGKAGRLVADRPTKGWTSVAYHVIKDNTMWSITFITREDEFEDRLPVFEQSVQSFTVND